DARNPDQPRPWAVGVLIGGELYLFDPTYGLPIPCPNGKGVATLSQAAADDAILRQMDIAGDRPYPRKSSELNKLVALLEASPGYLAPRSKQLESQLTGRDRMVLSTSPSALAEKLHEIKQIGEIKLWTMPYDILSQRNQMTRELAQAAQLELLPFNIPAEAEQ